MLLDVLDVLLELVLKLEEVLDLVESVSKVLPKQQFAWGFVEKLAICSIYKEQKGTCEY